MSNASSANFFTRILHSLLVFVLLGVFGYQLYSNIKNVNVKTLSYSVKTVNELVPPALTFCLTRSYAYNFTIEVYNVTVDRSAYLEMFPPESSELSTLRGQVARCWILSPPIGNNRALIKNPPPVANVPDMVLTTTRFDDGSGIVAPLLVNIFDPLQRDSLFEFNRFLTLNPDSNRAIQFTRSKRIGIDKSELNNIQYNIIDEFRSPDQTVPGVSSINKFTFRAASFDVEITTEVILVTAQTVIFNALTFLGVLIGSVYIPLVGQGKFRPWGYINRLTGYYPIEHIKQSPHTIETGLKRNDDSPTIEEKLTIYLERIGRAKYS